MKIIGNCVLVEKLKQKVEQGPGGLVQKDKIPSLFKGKIIMVGCGEKVKDYYYPPDFDIGDIIYYDSYGELAFYVSVQYKDKTCYIVGVHNIYIKGEMSTTFG